MLRSTISTVSAPAICPFRGSITHPTQPLCTLRGRRCRRLTQHSLPGRLLGLTWVGLAPTDRASLLGAFLHPGYREVGFNLSLCQLTANHCSLTIQRAMVPRRERAPGRRKACLAVAPPRSI